ncbi:GNAT family N-acetyltransferase [Paenibacillus montanisoli]|uniref:GNAT family N-acetyltransferase n=1 Tax=Paenibacillus montanisoli TaxID=2081970 RepID=UPI001401DCEC|nr:GNAT family N-acetyltransferase [Paenibacillus montanisoli]
MTVKESVNYTLRPIKCDELDAAHRLELACYTPEAAASREAFAFRQKHFPGYFWSAWQGGELIGLCCGVLSSESSCENDAVKSAHSEDIDGKHLVVLSVAVDPDRRLGGVGTALMKALLRQAEFDRLQSVALMCEPHLIAFYEGLGFEYIGVSASQHGGIEWHEMRRVIG